MASTATRRKEATVDLSNLATKEIFTTGEAAEVCKVSQQTIIRCFDSGRLGGFKVPGSKFRKIPRGELLKFMRENEIPTDLLDGRTGFQVLVLSAADLGLTVSEGTTIETVSNSYRFVMRAVKERPRLLVVVPEKPDQFVDLIEEMVEWMKKNPGSRMIVAYPLATPSTSPDLILKVDSSRPGALQGAIDKIVEAAPLS